MFYERFNLMCRHVGKSPTAVCVAIGLSNAAASHWKSGTLPKADLLVLIADYLNCSIDYLLGRTDQIEVNRGSDSAVSIGSNNTAETNINISLSQDDSDLLKLIHRLDLIERSRLICELSDRVNVEK